MDFGIGGTTAQQLSELGICDIEARIVKNSIGPNERPIVTWWCRYPLFVHPEHLRHRAFSFSVQSNRAIPASRNLNALSGAHVEPLVWTKERPGMSGREELSPWAIGQARVAWNRMMEACTEGVLELMNLSVHKSLANRPLGWFQPVTLVCTATDFDNFFALRCHRDADPHMQILAVRMARAYLASEPDRLDEGEWHLPFVDDEQQTRENADDLIYISAARCARTTYVSHATGKRSTVDEDWRLADKLIGATPRHASPFEHQGQAQAEHEVLRSGNFTGWNQFRKRIADENVREFDWEKFKEDYKDRDYIL
jgi:hypothetical protein